MAEENVQQRVRRLEDGRWEVRAYAKLNLGLRVFPVRPDGFHELETWMVPTTWHDTLWVDTSAEGLSLAVTGRAEGVPMEIEKNLVGRAAVRLAAAAGITPRGHITLHKVLPPGGGIGGGSSDAAHVLVALNEAWGLRWPEDRLEAVAAELGSDVPFFVRGGGGRASLCTGRGEIMTALRPVHALFAVLLIPPLGCPTKEVYQAFDAGHQHKPPVARTDWQACARATAGELSAMLVNDLEPAAFAVAPWLGELRVRAARVLQRQVHMTGSGSTLFTLCGSGAEAGDICDRAAVELEGACVSVAVCVGAEFTR